MKFIPLALLLLSSPAMAGGPRIPYRSTGDYSNYKAYRDYESNKGYASENICYRNEYREEYVPGNSKRPGYVTSYRERVEVPCKPWHRRTPSIPMPEVDPAPESYHHDEDGNKIKQTTRSVHLMVADCFMRPPLPGEEICHGAKGHRCNHVDNLRWGTHTSNMAETRGRVRGVVRRKRVFGTGVGNLTPLINEA